MAKLLKNQFVGFERNDRGGSGSVSEIRGQGVDGVHFGS